MKKELELKFFGKDTIIFKTRIDVPASWTAHLFLVVLFNEATKQHVMIPIITSGYVAMDICSIATQYYNTDPKHLMAAATVSIGISIVSGGLQG